MLLLVCGALAGFGVRSEREPMPAREVERPVVMPKGWTELSLGIDQVQASPDQMRWSRTEVMAGLRHGVAPGWELLVVLPWRHSKAFVAQHGFSTAEVGTRIGLLRGEAPARSLGLELRGRLPIGFDGGKFDGNAFAEGPLPDTTGTGDAVLALMGRQKWGGLRLDGTIFGMVRFRGRPTWFGGVLDPGDRVGGEASALLQLGPLALGASGQLAWTDDVRSDGERVEDSGGLLAGTGGRALLQISRGFEIEGRLHRSLVQTDSVFTLVSELDAVPVRTMGLGIRGRW